MILWNLFIVPSSKKDVGVGVFIFPAFSCYFFCPFLWWKGCDLEALEMGMPCVDGVRHLG